MKVKFISSAILFAVFFCFSAFSAVAQESEAVVVDEVVAQVNDSVITLSALKKEMKTDADLLVQQGKKPEEAQAEIEKKKGELIAGLIDEQLILQKGKDLGVDSDVDAQINQRFLEFMKQQNLKKIEDLYKVMNEQGVKPEEIRELWRKQITRDTVIQSEVSRKIYFGYKQPEMKAYFEAHKSQFTKPESVSLSELFLGFAGRDQAAVETKADQLMAQAKGGADFTKLVTENSERPDAAQTKGSVGTLSLPELNPQVAGAIKDAKKGDVVKLKVDEGIEIIRVDDRSAASSETVFNETAVRGAMTAEALPAAQKKYIAELRKDAYIKVADDYSPLVDPLLKDTTAAVETKKSDK